MDTRRRRMLGAALLSVASALVVTVALTRCASREDERAAPTTAVAASPHATTGGDERAPTSAAGPSAPESRTPDAGAASTFARILRLTDEHDRALLADIEQQTRRAPPPSVAELLALRRQGKSRAELEAFIHAQVQGGPVVRMAAMRWLRAISGTAEPTRDSDAGVLRAPSTTGARVVQKIARTHN